VVCWFLAFIFLTFIEALSYVMIQLGRDFEHFDRSRKVGYARTLYLRRMQGVVVRLRIVIFSQTFLARPGLLQSESHDLTKGGSGRDAVFGFPEAALPGLGSVCFR
jgi:hypothetical protein